MKRMVQWFAFLVSACAACAQGTLQVVVPSGHANVEGNSASASLFNTNFSRMLQVYSASEFGFLAGSTGVISSMAFRFDGATAQSFNGGWPYLAVGLSTTTRSPDSLSPVYNDNIGADLQTVFSNPLLIRATNPGVSPRMFEVLIQFSTPFYYDPSRGNLSFSFVSAPGPGNLILDAQDSFGDGVGRVFGPDGQTSGTVDSLGLITRFGIAVVPEPGPRGIAIAAVAAFLLFRPRSRKSIQPIK